MSEQLVIDDRLRVPVEVPETGRDRRRGLLGRDGLSGALWLQPCNQVHTFRMRFPIDVAYVGRGGGVLAVRRMPPGRLGGMRLRAKAVVEAEAGAFERWGLAADSTVAVQQHGTP